MPEPGNYLEEQESGVRVFIRVTPNAFKARVGDVENNRLKVYVTVPPEDGKANKAAVQLLAKHFKVPKTNIAIIAGQKSRDKVVFIAEGVNWS